MRIRVVSAALAVFATGCAAAGSGTTSSRVPVFLSEAEIPCQYEVIQTVRGFGSVASLRDYERERDVVLGRQGQRVGADAILIPEDRDEPGRGNVGVAVQRVGGVNQPTEAEFVGEAIRFVPGTCEAAVD